MIDRRAPNILRGRALSRRSFLRGGATAIALPWLDAMQPVRRAAAAPVLRSVFVFAPNGVRVDHWKPAKAGGDPLRTPTLEPLAARRRELTVFTGFAIDGGRSHGDGPGDHARAAASFLTCAHPVKTGGADIRAGVSIDQLLAAEIGGETPFPSLELGLEGGRRAGICDSGYSCAYSDQVSWRSPNAPVAKESDPRKVFSRLFGDPEQQESRAEEQRKRRRLGSVLDAALADLQRLRREVAPADRARLDRFADSVRDVELRIERLAEDEDVEQPKVSPDVLERHADDRGAGRMRLMYELIALALETDRTRVVSFMLGNGGSNRSHRFLDIPDGHHELSHHGGDAGKLDKIGRIDRYQIGEFATFLDALAERRDAAGSLLDASMVLYGSGIGDGNRHNHDDLPILLAGHGGGRLRSGQHVVFDREQPLANLYLTMLHVHGVGHREFADSTGTVSAIHG